MNYIGKAEKVDFSSKIIENMKNGTLNEILSQIISDNSSYIVQDGADAHIISTLGNNLNRINFSSINFGKCEEKLRNEYGIDETEEIILYEVEHSVEGFNIPIIEYVLFTQDGKTQLDLGLCDKLKVQCYIPVSIDEKEIDKHDPKSDYYNNECNQYSSEDGVDLTLYERKNDFNINNKSLCEKGCEFKGYNKSTGKVECFCDIKNDMSFYSNETNKDDLLNKLDSKKSSSNLKVTQCLNNVFSSTEQIKTNSGFYSLLLILVIFIIVFIIFCIKGRQMIMDKMDEIIYKKFRKNNIHNSHKNKKKKNKNNKKNSIIHKKKLKKKKPPFKQQQIRNSNLVSKNILIENKKMNLDTIIKGKINNNNQKISPKTIEPNPTVNEEKPDNDNDYELNKLSYLTAIKYDKRSCCEYYVSLLKNKQLFLFTFCSFNDYNSGIIKKYIFFLSFAVHYTINALFFDDSNMHQIYEDEGSYNLSYQFPKILLSAVFSTVFLRIILETLILTDRNVLKVKYQETEELANHMKLEVFKCINIKYVIFFVLNFILLILFWFYLTCFNGIYANTQIYLIENTFISFGLSLFYPFIWNIIPAIFRIFALNTKKQDRQYSYNFSKILHLI